MRYGRCKKAITETGRDSEMRDAMRLLPACKIRRIMVVWRYKKRKGKQVGRLTVTEQIDQKHQEDLQRLRGFRLLDDDFLTAHTVCKWRLPWRYANREVNA